VLPRFGVDALTALIADTGGLEGPVFVNRDGGWISKANMRRALRATLPDDLAWVTPHSFRRTVATVVRDAHGPAAAQQQLSHAKLATTEAHYLQRQTSGPDVRETLDRYAAGGKWRRKVSGKYQLMGVSRLVPRAFPLKVSAPEGIRTPNLLIRSQMLYPLSYGRMSSVLWPTSQPRRRREDLNLRSPLRATTH